MIKPNMHLLDRIARGSVGCLCIWAGFVDATVIANGLLSIAVGAFGILNIGSAIAAHCPLYFVTGIRTLREVDPNPNG